MRYILTFILCFLVLIAANGQYYQIIHVKGEIKKTETGDLIKPGDQLKEDDELSFANEEAMAAALNPEKGRFILKPTSEESTGSAGLVYILKSTITPVRGGMSTRASGINNAFDLEAYFGGRPYVWAGEAIFLRVSPASFPLNEENFFYLTYEYKGEKINKKLGFEDRAILMKKSELFSVDENPISESSVSNFELYYYKSSQENSTFITNIDFVLISQPVLENVYKAFENSEYPYHDVADMFADMYGKCDVVQVQYNLEQN